MLRTLYILIFIFDTVLHSGCQEAQPVRIGFVGELTSRCAGPGVSGRDGFLLAIEEASARGGIKGRKIEALARDARMHNETALDAVRTLFLELASHAKGHRSGDCSAATLRDEVLCRFAGRFNP